MKLNENIIIVADLGQLKAYRVSEVPRIDTGEVKESMYKSSSALSLITDIDYIASHMREGEQVSDQQGSFNGSNSEPHNKQIENTKRILKDVSEDIKRIIETEAPHSWCLAFPKENYKQLEGMLTTQLKSNLRKSLTSNLTNIPKEKLLSHFE